MEYTLQILSQRNIENGRHGLEAHEPISKSSANARLDWDIYPLWLQKVLERGCSWSQSKMMFQRRVKKYLDVSRTMSIS